MRKEFIIERQGKAFCLYAGLLDLAHQQGLVAIDTNLVQIPTESNQHLAIVVATVRLIQEGQEQKFTGIGDASPLNVAPAMRQCLIRMAETRAKARALRDAVNIGVAAYEELAEEDACDNAPEKGYLVGSYRSTKSERQHINGRFDAQRATTSEPKASSNAMNGIATQAQIAAILNLFKRQNIDPAEIIKSRFNLEGLEKLTKAQASELIQEYSKPPARNGVAVPSA